MSAIRHVGFYVKDISTSIKFFNTLGFKVFYFLNESWDKDLGELLVAKLKNSKKEVIEIIYDGINNNPKNSHVALTVEDLNSLITPLKKNGAKFLVDPRVSPDGSVLVAFCKDPNGITVELVQIL